MKGGPFEHERHRSPGEMTSQNAERLDFDQSLVVAILGMKMGRVMIVEVHPNHNSEKSRQLRHYYI